YKGEAAGIKAQIEGNAKASEIVTGIGSGAAAEKHNCNRTVSNVGWKTIDVSYEINGKIYVYTENIPFKSVVVGEQFYTLVNSEKLERALVYDNKPILDTIKYAFSIVTPNNISEPIADNDYLDYDYTVNGRKYSRIQKYYGDVPIPQNLDKLKVKYRIDRPEIGYLVE
ncbi:unnamed protein product, partial [Rotaria socialis]